MKKLIYCALALASGLFATSCMQENLEPAQGGTTVTFKVEIPEVATKAEAVGSEANMIDDLVYAVYKTSATDLQNALDNWEGTTTLLYAVNYNANPFGTNGSATISLELLNDQNHIVLLWAQHDNTWVDEVGTNIDLRNITYPEELSVSATSADKYAAFSAVKFIAANDKANSEAIKLTRPFAQINLATVDPENFNVVINSTQLTVKDAGAKFNVASQFATGNTDVNYSWAGKVDAEALTVNSHDYDHYLAMGYVFANGNVIVDYEINAGQHGIIDYTINQVPVAKNFRTNVIGNLLTSNVRYSVELDRNWGTPDNGGIYVFDAEQLQDAIDNATANSTTVICFADDISGNVTILQKEGVNLVIDGCGLKYDGIIIVNGNARANGEETLTFKNIKFETENSDFTFISAPSKIDGKYNYSHNVTIDSCTFTGNQTVGSANFTGTYNFVMNDCQATNMHSLLQIQSCDNTVTVEDVNVENCKSGISLGNVAQGSIKNAEISATGYGLRLDGAKERTVSVTVENSSIESFIPVSVRKLNNAECNVEIEFIGENTVEGQVYDVAFCSNEYEYGIEPAAPVGTYSLKGIDGLDVYYGPMNSSSAFAVSLSNTLEPEVNVEANIENVGKGFEINHDVVINFYGKELNAGSTANSTWYAIEAVGAETNVVINNANFTRAGVWAEQGANVEFNSGIINHNPERTSRYIFCAQSGSTITVNGGTFNNDREKNSYFWADNSTIYVKGGTFAGVASKNKVVVSNGGQVIITGGSFNFDPSAYVPEGYDVTLENDMYIVSEQPGYYVDNNGNYHITSAKGWTWMADQTDTFFGSKTVYLENDIDFANQEVPVTKMQTPDYMATFDGQNHTIYNVKILANYGSANQALFDGHMHIRNLTVDGANICGMSNVGVIGANIFGNIENCHVKRARSYAYTHHVGGIVGLHSWYDIKNCSVEDSSIWCYSYGAVGAIAGAKNEVSGNITGCSVKGCQLIKEGPLDVYPDWDNTFGIAVGYAYVSVNINNISSENNTIKGVVSDQLRGE